MIWNYLTMRNWHLWAFSMKNAKKTDYITKTVKDGIFAALEELGMVERNYFPQVELAAAKVQSTTIKTNHR